MEQKNKQLMIFLAGELRCDSLVRSLIEKNNFDFYAADAGVLLAERFGVSPDKVLGDFDSMPKPEMDGLLVFPAEKDQTDSELALELAYQDGYRDIWLIAPFGGRLDHTIANLCLLDASQKRNSNLKLYDGENLAFLLNEGNHVLSSDYRYISFFPWKKEAIISLEGFKYSLDHYQLVIEKPIGVSNEPKGATPQVQVHDGAVLCICIENTQEEV